MLIFELESCFDCPDGDIKLQEVCVVFLVLTYHSSGLLSPAELLAPLAWHRCPADWSPAAVTGSLSVKVKMKDTFTTVSFKAPTTSAHDTAY